MNSVGDTTHKISSYIKEKSAIILPQIRAYLAALLIIAPSVQVNSGIMQEQYVGSYQGDNLSKESAEKKVSYEAIFKNGIKRALSGIDELSQIPAGGKYLEYYRNEGVLKDKKLSPESVKKMNLPELMDIDPKSIDKPISSMTFIIGNRKFDISPDMCNIKKIYLTKDELVIKTTALIEITYNKDKKLPELMFRLWMAPKGKGEKQGFRATTVTEI